MGEWLGLLLWLAIAAGAPAQLILRDDATRLWPRPWESEIVFRPSRRAVSTWRMESARHVEAEPARIVGFVTGEGDALPRCVRLNNYWCVKRAGWAGEIAADREGHVAFSSAREGAIVAALLLRRYYVDYGRKSATTIVANWAPAECRGAVGGARIATRGLGATLRARWLARNRPGFTGAKFAGKRGGLRRSVVAQRPVPMLRAPTIAVGMGELAPAGGSIRLASLDLAAPPPGHARPAPAATCAGEQARLANYANRVIAGLVERPTDDLGLFDAAGEPTERLARALANMSSVEIGPLRARDALTADAVEGLREVLRKRREAAAPVQSPAP